MFKKLAAAVALFAALGAQVAHAELVTNGGFETGTLCSSISSWSGGGAFVAGAGCAVGPAHTGSQSAGFGAVGFLGTISQDLATVAGESYHLQFFLRSDGGTPSQFIVSVDGTTLLDISNAPITGYVEYNFDFLAIDGSTTLSFAGRNDPSWWVLDDVSVIAAAVSEVPEPGSLALLGLGLMGLAAARKRKQA